MQLDFGLHDLAIEDAQNMHLRPKSSSTTGAIDVRGAAHRALRRQTEEVDFGEVSVFIGRQFVLASVRARATWDARR